MPISVKHDLSILILHKILIQTSPSPFNPKHFKRTKVKTETRKHYNLRNREGFKLKAKIDDKRHGPCQLLREGWSFSFSLQVPVAFPEILKLWGLEHATWTHPTPIILKTVGSVLHYICLWQIYLHTTT